MALSRVVLKGLLDEGGQAFIYAGLSEALMVAFKCFKRPDQETRETAFLLGIRDRRIIRPLGLSIDHELSGIVLEYVAGSTLRLILNAIAEQSLRPSPSLIAYLAHEIHGALQHLHQQQTMHNDLSPANILFNPTGALKLCDFGAAKLLGNKSTVGPAFGKRPYMALELLYGAEPSFASDHYAHATVLFELLTGQAFRPTYPSFAFMTPYKNALPALLDWIMRALAPLPKLRPRAKDFPSFPEEQLLQGKAEMVELIKLAPMAMASAGLMEGRVIEFVRFAGSV